MGERKIPKYKDIIKLKVDTYINDYTNLGKASSIITSILSEKMNNEELYNFLRYVEDRYKKNEKVKKYPLLNLFFGNNKIKADVPDYIGDLTTKRKEQFKIYNKEKIRKIKIDYIVGR